jgi:hypothetical protein
LDSIQPTGTFQPVVPLDPPIVGNVDEFVDDDCR